MTPHGTWVIIGWIGLGLGLAGPAAAEDAPPAATAPAEATGTDAATTAPSTTPEERVPADALQRKVSLDFQDANLKDVLKLFSQQAGINFIASEQVKDRKITLYVDQVTVQDVLNQLMRANNLVYDSVPESNIFIIRESGSAGPTLVTKIYRLQYARLSTSVLAKAVSAIGSTGAASGSASRPGIDQVITKLLTTNGSLVVDERTNALIITDTPENFQKIERAIAELDVKTAQILIEVELLEVSATKAKNLGVEWGTGTDGTLATFTPGQATTHFPFNLSQHQMIPTQTLNPAADEILQTRPTYTLGTLNTAQFQVVLKALQSDQDTRLLAHPKVLTLDNEQAVIELVAQTAIGQKTSTVATGGTGSTSTEAERTQTGVKLKVTPQLNADGNITMLVEPSLSRPNRSEFFPTLFVDPKTRSATTLVRVRDGETIMIGGLIDRSESGTKRRVPGLGDVPLVGAAFRKNDTALTDTELVVFITPRIVDNPQLAGLKTALHLPPLGPEQEPVVSRDEAIESILQQLASPAPATGP